ncbi:MAG: 2-oxo acid dehydrogenase subunit E2, partial [Pseudolysinimonas sp.]
MSSPITGTAPDDPNSGEFGANEWLVDELYERYLVDKNSVDKSWWPVLESYHPVTDPTPTTSIPVVTSPVVEPVETTTTEPPEPSQPTTGATPIARTTSAPAKPQPIPAEAPQTSSIPVVDENDAPAPAEDVVTPLRGMSKTLAANMDASLTVPTATSVRTVPAKLMIDNRIVINNHLRRARGGKVSFTHLIGWAIVQTLKV